MSARGAERRHARDGAPQPRAQRPGLSAGHPRRRARATMSSRPAGTPPSLVVTAKRIDRGDRRKARRDGVKVITVPENRWERVDIKTVGLLPNVLAKQKAQGGRRLRGLVRRPRRHRHRGRIHQRLDRRRRTACWSRGRPSTASCAASPARRCSTSPAKLGLKVEERGIHRRGSQGGARSLHHRRHDRGHAGRRDRRATDRQRPSRADGAVAARRLFRHCGKDAGLITGLASRESLIASRPSIRRRRPRVRLTCAIIGALDL